MNTANRRFIGVVVTGVAIALISMLVDLHKENRPKAKAAPAQATTLPDRGSFAYEGEVMHPIESITMGDDLAPYSQIIFAAINRLALQHPRCKQIDLASVRFADVQLSDTGKRFNVICISSEAELMLAFTENEILENTPLYSPLIAAASSAAAAERRNQRIRRGFSGWDGSHRELTRWVKSSLKDPKSYQHVETRYVDQGTDTLLVIMTYRAKNSFGGVVPGQVTARVHLDGHVTEIINSQ